VGAGAAEGGSAMSIPEVMIANNLATPHPAVAYLFLVRRLDSVRTLTGSKANIMKNNFSALILPGLLALSMASCDLTSTEKVSVPVVPDSIKVPPTEVLSFAANAKGVQIYECRVKKDTTAQYEWFSGHPRQICLTGAERGSAVITADRPGSRAMAVKS
jgi:hypothetical protein